MNLLEYYILVTEHIIRQSYNGKFKYVFFVTTNCIYTISDIFYAGRKTLLNVCVLQNNVRMAGFICMSMFQGLFRIAGSASRLKKLKVCISILFLKVMCALAYPHSKTSWYSPVGGNNITL